MNCDEMLKALSEYIDDPAQPGLCEEFRKHLEGCNPCQVVVDNVRKTIKLFNNGEPYPLPPALHDRLRQCLIEKWKTKFSKPR